jgi:hypothetical protein
MTSDAGAIAALLGHEPEPPAWRLGTAEPVPMRRWGKDHWTTFAYVETRWVDHRGMLDHDRMRCDRRHSAFYAAKRRTTAFGSDVDGARYPTRLKSGQPGDDGAWGSVNLPGHDDYNCLDDAITEGLITARMPVAHEGGYGFLDAYERIVAVPGGERIDPSFVTGLSEMWLMTAASYDLTERGQAIAGELRAHMAATRRSHQFMPSETDR